MRTIGIVSIFICILISVTVAATSLTGSNNEDEEWLRVLMSQISPRLAEMGADILNTKVAPIAEKALSALKLGTKAFKFTKIDLGSKKPTLNNIR